MTRKELFNYIKEHNLQNVIYKQFNKPYSSLSTDELNGFINTQGENALPSLEKISQSIQKARVSERIPVFTEQHLEKANKLKKEIDQLKEKRTELANSLVYFKNNRKDVVVCDHNVEKSYNGPCFKYDCYHDRISDIHIKVHLPYDRCKDMVVKIVTDDINMLDKEINSRETEFANIFNARLGN